MEVADEPALIITVDGEALMEKLGVVVFAVGLRVGELRGVCADASIRPDKLMAKRSANRTVVISSLFLINLAMTCQPLLH